MLSLLLLFFFWGEGGGGGERKAGIVDGRNGCMRQKSGHIAHCRQISGHDAIKSSVERCIMSLFGVCVCV